jgi:hypothetical protein
MPAATHLPSQLVDAYRRTRFRVDDADGRFILTVGVYSEELALCHQRNQVDSSAFITAWNPGSQICSVEENETAQMAMVNLVIGLGYKWISGVGANPDEHWPGEPSILILGIKESEALGLASRFGQNAIIVNGASAIPELRFP